jgi:hypothetical protein
VIALNGVLLVQSAPGGDFVVRIVARRRLIGIDPSHGGAL